MFCGSFVLNCCWWDLAKFQHGLLSLSFLSFSFSVYHKLRFRENRDELLEKLPVFLLYVFSLLRLLLTGFFLIVNIKRNDIYMHNIYIKVYIYTCVFIKIKQCPSVCINRCSSNLTKAHRWRSLLAGNSKQNAPTCKPKWQRRQYREYTCHHDPVEKAK